MNSGAPEHPADEKSDAVPSATDASQAPPEKVETDQGKPEEAEAQKVDDSATDVKDVPVPVGGSDDVKMSGTGAESRAEEDKEKQEVETKEPEPAQPNGTHDEAPAQKEETKPSETNGDAVVPEARKDDLPSTILEKGVIYFFFRARVNVDDPHDVKDIARSYLVMRPIPLDAKLGDGPIGDQGNCRLLALPKKVLPLSGKDRFMIFVEKAKTSFGDLKDSFMTGSDYATKTAGTSHTPAVTPVAEGVYAITSTGRESHLAYMINIPSELGQVQKDIGLRERGSFVTSVKNPSQPQPSNASLPKGPEYPQEILDEFRNLRWKPLEPKHLDYVNTQFLLIGESFDKAMEERPKDERENNVAPNEEMEKLEGEDEIRVKHLKGKTDKPAWQFLPFANRFSGDDAIFDDLGITSKEFPKVPTTW